MHLSIHARVDKQARTYVQSRRNGPEWGHVARRATMNLGDNTRLQGIKIQDQPIGHTYNAPLPNGLGEKKCTRLRWEPQEPVLIGPEDQRPRPRRVAFVDDDRLPPLRLSVA
eukprot:3839851-Pyramimonas_sp.AAC.1